MPGVTGAASTALDATVVRPVFLAYLDFVGDPVRVNSSGANITPSGTGDAELDGLLFDGVSGDFVDVSEVTQSQGGSDTVTAQISGLPSIDADTLTLIGNPANWQGRVARLWKIVRNEGGVQQGAIAPYYTGYMVAVDIAASPDSQTIRVTIESYLSAPISQASNRSYLDQEFFDSGDKSAQAAIAIANGNSGNPLTNNTATPGAISSEFGFNRNVRNV